MIKNVAAALVLVALAVAAGYGGSVLAQHHGEPAAEHVRSSRSAPPSPDVTASAPAVKPSMTAPSPSPVVNTVHVSRTMNATRYGARDCTKHDVSGYCQTSTTAESTPDVVPPGSILIETRAATSVHYFDFVLPMGYLKVPPPPFKVSARGIWIVGTDGGDGHAGRATVHVSSSWQTGSAGVPDLQVAVTITNPTQWPCAFRLQSVSVDYVRSQS